MTDIETLALKLWQERELRFPERVRRMLPDATDRLSGTWDHMVKRATEEKLKGIEP